MITRNRWTWGSRGRAVLATVMVLGCGGGSSSPPHNMSPGFHVEEATIADIQTAIQNKQITCVDLVKTYLARITAYNGPCTRLVSADGAPITPATGYV